MMEDGRGFTLLPGSTPSTQFGQWHRDARLELWAQVLSGDQSTPNSHPSTKVYAGALRLPRKDCFRAQTSLNCSDKQATIAGDRCYGDSG
jgi:hypothetical protein